MSVAALYVDPFRGPYRKIPGVELWGILDATRPGLWDRDARNYDGPGPVVAHPPCGPWAKFAWHYKGGEGAKECGPRAVAQVRRWGGVLEHPEGSKLWRACGLPAHGGEEVDRWGGWTLRIEQVDFGHPARKPTWLYIVGTETIPPLPRNKAGPTHCMVRLKRNPHDLPELPKRLRHLTPPALAFWLVAAARRAATPRP